MMMKLFRIIKYYFKLIKYAFTTDSELFHIQWLNKFIYFDRTFLNLYYKFLGKKIIFTAHNINAGIRDENDTFLNRITLKLMYSLIDHIIVHTNKMRCQLIESFNIRENKVTIIPYGINDTVYKSSLTKKHARKKLELKENDKVILFFGFITIYKGIEYLLLALAKLKEKYNNLTLVIAGEIDTNGREYWENLQKILKEYMLEGNVITKLHFIPDKDIEIFFKSADVLILPYKFIFQSGPLFLAYNFGLPVIAADVGSLKEDIIEGMTGFICNPKDPEDLADKISYYFNSELYKNLEQNSEKIIKYTNEKYSWKKIGEQTFSIYKNLMQI